MKAIIEDGYNESATFEAIPHLAPEFSIRYRPFRGMDLSAFIVALTAVKDDPEARCEMLMTLLHERINEITCDGETAVTPSLEYLEKLRPAMIQQIIEELIQTRTYPTEDDSKNSLAG